LKNNFVTSLCNANVPTAHQGMISFCHQAERHITVKIIFDQYHIDTSLELTALR